MAEEEFMNSENAQASEKTSDEFKWYVVHTYSGYENKVKANIEKLVENRNMHDRIQEVIVPLEDEVEIKEDGKKKVVQRKVFPGYVLLKMIMDDDTWYVVRNTRGVTSFVGPGSKPVALTDDEVSAMGIESYVETFNINVGDAISVISGPFAESTGIVKEVNINKRTVVVMLSIFGRETPTELDFSQVRLLA